jgi:hypothetical protein
MTFISKETPQKNYAFSRCKPKINNLANEISGKYSSFPKERTQTAAEMQNWTCT